MLGRKIWGQLCSLYSLWVAIFQGKWGWGGCSCLLYCVLILQGNELTEKSLGWYMHVRQRERIRNSSYSAAHSCPNKPLTRRPDLHPAGTPHFKPNSHSPKPRLSPPRRPKDAQTLRTAWKRDEDDMKGDGCNCCWCNCEPTLSEARLALQPHQRQLRGGSPPSHSFKNTLGRRRLTQFGAGSPPLFICFFL